MSDEAEHWQKLARDMESAGLIDSISARLIAETNGVFGIYEAKLVTKMGAPIRSPI
jgi:hypothetical protein